MGTTGSAPIVLVQQRIPPPGAGELQGGVAAKAYSGSVVAASTIRVASLDGNYESYPAILGRSREFYNVPVPAGGLPDPRFAGFSERGAVALAQAALFGFWKTKHGDGAPLPTLGLNTQYGFTGIERENYGVLEHPSGWKYGLMNCKRTASSAVYRSDRYGQLRDQLEQRQYTKFWDAGDETNPAGIQEPSVSCIFVDGDGNPLTEPRLTTCFNVSSEMTSSVPYKEGVTARSFLFNSETVSITPLVQSFTASPFLSGID